MKPKIILLLLLAVFALLLVPLVAGAHTLDDAAGTIARLAHQVLGLHHAPLLVLIAGIGIALVARAITRRN